MSTFLIHQESGYLVLLADSLGTKTHTATDTTYPLTAPKLVHVGAGVYATHAGTLQPAIEMLSELGSTRKIIPKGLLQRRTYAVSSDSCRHSPMTSNAKVMVLLGIVLRMVTKGLREIDSRNPKFIENMNGP